MLRYVKNIMKGTRRLHKCLDSVNSPVFVIIQTCNTFGKARLYLTEVANAELQWRLSDMNMVNGHDSSFYKIEIVANVHVNEGASANRKPAGGVINT